MPKADHDDSGKPIDYTVERAKSFDEAARAMMGAIVDEAKG